MVELHLQFLRAYFVFLGILDKTINLDFAPHSYNAAACDDWFIYIIQHHPPLLSVHDWTGQQLIKFDCKTLGQSEKGSLVAIGSTVDNNIVLGVDTWGELVATQLAMYKVE